MIQHVLEAEWLRRLRHEQSRVEVVLFGFQTVVSDWSIAPRRLDEHLFYFLLGGDAEGAVDETPVALRAGSLLWVRPGVPHVFRIPPGGRAPTLYHLRFRLFRQRKNLTLGPGFVLQQDLWEARRWIEALYDEHGRPAPSQTDRRKSLLHLLATECLRPVSPQNTRRTLPLLARQKIRDYLCQHLSEQVTPGDLADTLRLSRDYFSRVFRATFGLSPRTWIVQERVRQAALLLCDKPEANIGEIAKRLGFCDIYLFSRQFKQVTGLSPSAYRRARQPPGRAGGQQHQSAL